jgi:hypothetical protein
VGSNPTLSANHFPETYARLKQLLIYLQDCAGCCVWYIGILKEKLMINLLLITSLTIASTSVLASGKNNEILFEDGEIATACGIVSSITHLKKSSGNTTLISIGPAYPDHVFSIVIQDEKLNFPDLHTDSLKGKRVCVTGIAEKYKGKAQIELKNEKDLKLD